MGQSKDVLAPIGEVSMAWNTRDELRFLKALKERNFAAFEGYRQSLSLRKRWGRIDPVEIAKFLGENWGRGFWNDNLEVKD